MDTFTNNTQNEDHKKALELLNTGEVVSIPTETVYGLAANITDSKAIEKIFTLKERPFFDPLIVHLANAGDVEKVATNFPPLARHLSEKFWPGPLTMILPKREDLNPMITAGLATVGVRVPDHKLTLRLITELGQPLAAPSANKFTKTSPTCAEHVRAEFGDSVFVLDGGPCKVGVESTIIGFNSSYDEIIILRPGLITIEMLAPFAKIHARPAAHSGGGTVQSGLNVDTDGSITQIAVEVKNPSISPQFVPGGFKQHYQPRIPLVIISSETTMSISLYEKIRTELQLDILHPQWMSLPSDSALAARVLYENLRSAGGPNCILLFYPLTIRNFGLWSAITDRLSKAATLIL
jgi:L-threonylcarbamoyladenylate synthase